MKYTFLSLLVLVVASMANAQEAAKYRVTYDCDAQNVVGKVKTYRWILDIGETSAVFYNENFRAFNREVAEMKASGDAIALMDKLPVLGQKYPNRQHLQIVVGMPENGQYTYCTELLAAKIRYEEKIPTIEWQMTDSTKTICEYVCQQAIGSMYGRTWAVWFTPELPLNYGPYVLQGLPGLIMAAKDSEGLFDFVAVGIENAPEGTVVSACDIEDAQKCSRKRFLEMRSESEGLSNQQAVDRLLNRQSDGNKMKLIAIRDKDGRDISKDEMPKKNYLDKE